jgi:hypothetical protein
MSTSVTSELGSIDSCTCTIAPLETHSFLLAIDSPSASKVDSSIACCCCLVVAVAVVSVCVCCVCCVVFVVCCGGHAARAQQGFEKGLYEKRPC